MAYSPVYYGIHGYALIGREDPTAYGTAVACTKDIGLIQNLTMSESNTLRRLHTISQRDASEISAGRYTVGGSIEFLFQHGRMLEYALGLLAYAAHVETDTPDIKHNFTVQDAVPSFSLEDGFNSTTDAKFIYAGCKVNSLTLALALDGSLTCRVDLIGKTVATTAESSAAVIDTVTTFPDYMATISTGTDGSETALRNVQSIEWTVNNNLEAIGETGARLINDLQGNERTYDFTFSMAFASKVEYELFLGGTAPSASTPTIPSMVINITNGIAAASGLRQINIDMANCYYEAVRTPTVIKGAIIQEFTGWAKALTGLFTYDDVSAANWPTSA